MSADQLPQARPVAVFDLDGTITRFDTLGPFLMACLARRPWRLARLALVLPAAARYLIQRDRGALKGALLHAALGGLSRVWLAERSAVFVRWVLRRALYAEALESIDRHRLRGDRLMLMSASTDLYIPQLAEALGFELVQCSQVRWEHDGRLDGRLDGANCRGLEKQRRLQALIERERPARVYAYGNSAADVPHLLLAQEGYLVNGPRRLALPAVLHRVNWSRRAQPTLTNGRLRA
ncbi:MAG TPA: HAD-IB family hydrolase, partial [Steroidobacteraceae bacterium]